MNDLFQSNEKLETVCGGKIEDPDRYPSAFYQGKRVYFCSKACMRAFEDAPEAFMAGKIDHPIE